MKHHFCLQLADRLERLSCSAVPAKPMPAHLVVQDEVTVDPGVWCSGQVVNCVKFLTHSCKDSPSWVCAIST